MDEQFIARVINKHVSLAIEKEIDDVWYSDCNSQYVGYLVFAK